MSGELDPNAALFGGDEQEDPEKEHLEMTFGRNPNRTSAMADLFLKDMIATVENDPDIPAEARPAMIFKMTANSVLDIVMESLDPDTREEVAASIDGYLGVCLVNTNFEVDLFGEMTKALTEVKQEDGESDEDFQRRLADMEDAWWGIPQPRLNGRNPSDAVTEQVRRYGLE